MPRLNLLRHHRRGSDQPKVSPAKTPPPQTAAPPIPRTSPPLDSLPPLNIGNSPGLGTPEQWLQDSTGTPTTPPTAPDPRSSPRKSSKSNGAASAMTPAGGNTNTSSNTKDTISSYRRNAKLTLLNPMSLLTRRRSSQTNIEKERSRGARDLPDDFDPGIIYGTRHPDWSSGPKREKEVLTPVNGRQLSPLPVMNPLLAPGNKLLKVEVVADGEGGGKRAPVFKECFEEEENGEKRAPMTMPPEREAPGPPPPTTAPPPVPKVEMTLVPVQVDEESDNEGELESPPDGRPRVALFDHPLSLPHHLMTNSSRFSFEGSSAAGESTPDDYQRETEEGEREEQDYDPDDSGAEVEMDLEDMDDDDDEGFSRANEGLFGEEEDVEEEQDPIQNLSIAPPKDDPPNRDSTVSGGAFTVAEQLPTMDPTPSAMIPHPGPIPCLPLSKRIANPRGYDLDADSDLDFLEDDGMAGYEDEEDDMYFDDGIILDDPPDQRLSLSTIGISSGGAMHVEDGSMSPTHGSATVGGGAGSESKSFPPFINPIGGGLGYTQEQAQFYAPDGTMLDSNGCPLALSTLTQSLWQYQKEQQRLAEEQGGEDYEYDAGYEDDDETMVAAANAEALAYDTEFYGQEFGFYPAPPSSSHSESSVELGGYFGPPGGEVLARPPLLRRPSLTPISERSESSWRNSMVFPVEGWKGLGAQRPLSALSFGGGQEDEGMEGLRRLRRSAWGGSQGSLGSLGGGGTGGAESPLASPVGVPPGWGNVGSPLAGGLSAPPPPGLYQVASPPPGLSHPGANAMLPTKGSFEEQQLGYQKSTADSSYASAVGSPVDVEEAGERRGEVEKWVLRGGSRGSRGSRE